MAASKQTLIDNFFKAYSERNKAGIKQVMDEHVTWSFLGQHKLAGIKTGIDEVIAFFDKMGSIMSESKPTIQKLIIAENDIYLIECQHIKTNRDDGINIEHDVTVLWEFENGKIISGKHFFADPKAVDNYFNAVPLLSDILIGFNPLIIEQTYSASINKVWNAITDENQMRKWYFDTMKSFKPVVGFETEFNVPSNGKDYLHIWKVTEVVPEKKITYNWKFGGYPGESLVSFEILKENNLTKIKLMEVGIESFPQNNPDFTRESWTEGWNYFICKRLKEYLERA
ncbi:MAG: SRPBCC domain-containing protein [Paludibacter sp.]|nr:SRPBCC domain-containing protein [Paludibacter sp.]